MEKNKQLTPFKLAVLQNFPYIEADFDALTNYGLLCKIVEYLNKTIEQQNITGENVNSFVTWFENLDVQDEINNKLDDMAKDGSLINLISNYIDPIITPFETRIENKVDTIESQLNGIASGSPAGVYANLTTLRSQNPDHSKIYITSDNGHWNYFNSVTNQFESGGVYQSTEFPEVNDIRNGAFGKKYSSAGNSVRKQIIDANADLVYLGETKKIRERIPCELVIGSWSYDSNNLFTLSAPNQRRATVSEILKLKKNATLIIKCKENYNFQFRSIDANPYTNLITRGWLSEGSFETNEMNDYFFITFRDGDGTTGVINLSDLSENIEFYYEYPFIETDEDVIPVYYQNYIKNKADIINSLKDNSPLNGDSFIFITDYHRQVNTKHSSKLIKYLLDNTGTRFAIFGGDTQDYETTFDAAMQQTLGYKQDFSKIWNNMFQNIGNHEFNSHYHVVDPDTYGEDIMLTWNQAYNILDKQKENEYISKSIYGDYCFDNVAQKIRYFVLTTDYTAELTTQSAEWYMNELTKVPNGYSVVIIAHISLKESSTPGTVYNKLLYAGNMRNVGLASVSFNNKGTYTFNNKQYNYSNKNAEVILILSGHTHYDVDNRNYEITEAGSGINILTVTTTTDAYARQSNKYGQLSRTVGTITEQAFDVVRIDKQNRKIKFIRIGAGLDREFRY